MYTNFFSNKTDLFSFVALICCSIIACSSFVFFLFPSSLNYICLRLYLNFQKCILSFSNNTNLFSLLFYIYIACASFFLLAMFHFQLYVYVHILFKFQKLKFHFSSNENKQNFYQFTYSYILTYSLLIVSITYSKFRSLVTEWSLGTRSARLEKVYFLSNLFSSHVILVTVRKFLLRHHVAST